MFLVLFILSVVFVEALTELFVKSLIFSRLREFVKSKNDFVKDILSCGYCTSVWVSLFPALYLSHVQTFCAPLVGFLLFWVSLHRLANYLHNINDKYFDKFYAKK
jgi:hypothetical protein